MFLEFRLFNNISHNYTDKKVKLENKRDDQPHEFDITINDEKVIFT